jgi:WD40 repeat protein
LTRSCGIEWIRIRGAQETPGRDSFSRLARHRVSLLTISSQAFSQGRPDIPWAKAGHSDSVNSVTYSPDGQLLVSGSSDRTIKIWRHDGTFIRSLAIPYDPNAQLTDVRSVAVSPDSTLIAAGVEQYNAGTQTSFGAVQIWRISDGVLVQNFTGYGAAVNAVAFSPDGQYVASGEVTGLAFSHDGTLLAFGAFFDGNNDVIKLWNVSNWMLVRQLSGPFLFGPFVDINFSTDDTLLAASCESVPAVWQVSDGTFLRSFPVIGLTRFSPDGTLFVIGSNPVRVYRTSDWLQVASLSDQNQALAFTPNSHYLGVAGRSQIQFWRVSDWTLQLFYDQELGYNGFGVTSLAFSPDASRFAYGRMDAVVAVATNPLPLDRSQ